MITSRHGTDGRNELDLWTTVRSEIQALTCFLLATPSSFDVRVYVLHYAVGRSACERVVLIRPHGTPGTTGIRIDLNVRPDRRPGWREASILGESTCSPGLSQLERLVNSDCGPLCCSEGNRRGRYRSFKRLNIPETGNIISIACSGCPSIST